MGERIAILLTEGFADWEFGLLAGAARGYYNIDTVFVSPGGSAVTSMGGLRVSPAQDCFGLAPVSFAAQILGAVGVPQPQVDQLRSMLGGEHSST